MFFSPKILFFFGLISIAVSQVVHAGSDDCGRRCDTKTDCPGGNCRKDINACPDAAGGESKSYNGKCSSGNKCGMPCNTDADCSPDGGSCWAVVDCGKCNYKSGYKCGLPCKLDGDCFTGQCWAKIDKNECADILLYYCDAQSSNKCGRKCNEGGTECSPGQCVKYETPCGENAGYCDLRSTNCGTSCKGDSQCYGGHCMKDKLNCQSRINIGTYIGAMPGGTMAPSLDMIPTELNLIMLGFAKDANHDGNFTAFSGWGPQGLTKTAIQEDKARNPGRRYLISVGGTAGYGGTFQIQEGMRTEDWVSNSVQSIVGIITSLSADGAEIQFEGNTGDSRFKDAITGVLKGLKDNGYLTAIGPFFGTHNTWQDYRHLPITYVDFLNLQFYSVEENDPKFIQYFIEAVLQYLGTDSFKLVAGFNSHGSKPQPEVAFQAVKMLQGYLRGAFTWSIENSQKNVPPYCLEKGLAALLKDKDADLPNCQWQTDKDEL